MAISMITLSSCGLVALLFDPDYPYGTWGCDVEIDSHEGNTCEYLAKHERSKYKI